MESNLDIVFPWASVFLFVKWGTMLSVASCKDAVGLRVLKCSHGWSTTVLSSVVNYQVTWAANGILRANTKESQPL